MLHCFLRKINKTITVFQLTVRISIALETQVELNLQFSVRLMINTTCLMGNFLVSYCDRVLNVAKNFKYLFLLNLSHKIIQITK